MTCHNQIDRAATEGCYQSGSESDRLASLGEYLARNPRLMLTMLDLMEKSVERKEVENAP